MWWVITITDESEKSVSQSLYEWTEYNIDTGEEKEEEEGEAMPSQVGTSR